MSRRYERFMKARLEQQAELARQVVDPIDWDEPEPVLSKKLPRSLLIIAVMIPWALVLVTWISAKPVEPITYVVDDPYGKYIGELLERN